MTDTFLSARWEDLVMANYAVDPAILQPYLPKGVELDTFRDNAYISLVGFMFKQTSLFHIPIPFLGTFEEINLRFYVKRVEAEGVKRGVVFINETVPFKAVAWLANRLYKEHYMAIPTKNTITRTGTAKQIRYEWKINKAWNHLAVNAAAEKAPMLPGSIEEFIFEHYYGYTRIDAQSTQEYKVNHPRWLVNTVNGYDIHCDFRAMYGDSFAFLQHQPPDSVILAEGSPVTVKWKRTDI
ncbi:YqjF family protein [Flavihumibacter fluvii]|uniref:YqjF family protein n=1 Tax=Flavihumibacter fluvii TaxID=2838157 RepID=UPI001BDE343E|nr:DUF2071 domain-containing protein [Flavihumibacter fluvii]ULQ50955.1 DUF2071 domain-containing protein [Flavihumibacter fluvii]